MFVAAALGLRAERGAAPTGTPVSGRALDPYFEAVVDAAEEAVLVSLLAAGDVTRRGGAHHRRAAGGPVTTHPRSKGTADDADHRDEERRLDPDERRRVPVR